MKANYPLLVFVTTTICALGCNTSDPVVVPDANVVKAEIDSILKIQEDAYDQNNEEGRKKLAATCSDSLVFIGGDDGGLGTSVNMYVNDLADGYSKRPADKKYRMYENMVIVTSIYQSFKRFNSDTIYFNVRSTKIFNKIKGEWKMTYITYAPMPVHYTQKKIVSDEILNSYAGLYYESPTVTDTISITGGKIYLAPTGSTKMELLPLNDSTFFGEGYFGKTIFSKNNQGIVSHYYFEFADGQRLTFKKL